MTNIIAEIVVGYICNVPHCGDMLELLHNKWWTHATDKEYPRLCRGLYRLDCSNLEPCKVIVSSELLADSGNSSEYNFSIEGTDAWLSRIRCIRCRKHITANNIRSVDRSRFNGSQGITITWHCSKACGETNHHTISDDEIRVASVEAFRTIVAETKHTSLNGDDSS